MTEAYEPLRPLAEAIRAGNVSEVERILVEQPEIRAHINDAVPTDCCGATPLLTAVYAANREIVDVLLRHGADINQRSHWWPGSFGVLDNGGPLGEYLIERGAKIDAHSAARMGKIDVLDRLLAADPGLVHARGGDGQTPLHFAQTVAVAEYLLAHRANIDARDVDHESTPAQWMIRDRTEVARYLVNRGARADILMAAALGDAARVARILDTDPSAVHTAVADEYFPKENPRCAGTIYQWTLGLAKTAHVVAREFGHEDVFRLLLDRSPSPLKLRVLCEVGDADGVAALLAREPGVTTELRPEDHRRLADAARDDNTKAVPLLLSAGWPVDARGQHGATALHWAGWNGNLEITRELLRHHASLEILSHEHPATPLSWTIYASVHGWRCKTGDYAGVVAALLDAGARAPEVTPNLQASDAVREVLDNRPDQGR